MLSLIMGTAAITLILLVCYRLLKDDLPELHWILSFRICLAELKQCQLSWNVFLLGWMVICLDEEVNLVNLSNDFLRLNEFSLFRHDYPDYDQLRIELETLEKSYRRSGHCEDKLYDLALASWLKEQLRLHDEVKLM